MTISVYVALALSLLAAVLVPRLATRLAPGTAVRTVGWTVGLSALASTWALALLAATLVQEAPLLIEKAQRHGVLVSDPVPGLMAVAAVVLLVAGVWRLGVMLSRHRSLHRELRALSAAAPPGELVVSDSELPYAVAVPGRPGRIVVASAMLRLLDADERRVVYAHERAHLIHSHHRWCAVAEAAAALNPLLGPGRDAVAFLVERWADEDAAQQVGSRGLVAQSLTRAALGAAEAQRCARLGFHQLAVTQRVLALRAHPAPQCIGVIAVAVLLAAGLAVFAGDATFDFLRWHDAVAS
ncbi:MAG TPA: M56 family metallopeptidase [Pseudonocardiaceae bacterium]